jgi:hypothetical protein
MKQIILLLLLAIPLFGLAQKKRQGDPTYYQPYIEGPAQNGMLHRNQDGDVEYSGVVDIDTASSLTLYNRASEFVIREIKSQKSTAQLNDRDARKIVLRCYLPMDTRPVALSKYSAYVTFVFEIECKDNRYRYLMSDFYYNVNLTYITNVSLSQGRAQGLSKRVWRGVGSEVSSDVNHLIKALKEYMSGQKGDNW